MFFQKNEFSVEFLSYRGKLWLKIDDFKGPAPYTSALNASNRPLLPVGWVLAKFGVFTRGRKGVEGDDIRAAIRATFGIDPVYS